MEVSSIPAPKCIFTNDQEMNEVITKFGYPLVPLIFSRFEFLLLRTTPTTQEILKITNKYIEKTQILSKNIPKCELLFDTINFYSSANQALILGVPKITLSDRFFTYNLDFEKKLMTVLFEGIVKETVGIHIARMPPIWYFRSSDGTYSPLLPFNQLKIWKALREGKKEIKISLDPLILSSNVPSTTSALVGSLSGAVSSKIGDMTSSKLEINLKDKKQIQGSTKHDLYDLTDILSFSPWEINISYPENASKITQEQIKKDSPEWNNIARLFYITMPSKIKLISVEKIINPILRDNWKHELNMVKRKNNDAQIPYVKLLWNGTGTTPPSAIYSNDKGWMVNYSTDDNLWGKGAYFSEDVGYVCGKKNGSFTFKYAHKTKNNTIKLFLAEVIVGDPIQLEETQNLPQPPNKEGSDQRYDSVQGFRHNTFIYCIKDNGRAYPTYVVEFSQK